MLRVLLLFVDGVGLADEADWNPIRSASLPSFSDLLEGRLPTAPNASFEAARATLVGLDATLGIGGIPQSGTGQATLLTGTNAAAAHGRHFGPWVPLRLQKLVREESVLARALANGRTAAFANAYPEEVLRLVDDGTETPPLRSAPEAGVLAAPAARRRRRAPSFLRAGPPLAALGAGLLNRHTAELARGDAVASEITNDGWRSHLGRTDLPEINAATAGRNLVRIAAAHDLTLFAHYATDYAGHRADMSIAIEALERLDAFLGGILDSMPADLLVFVVSDHGNIEDTRAGHTRNPALGLVIGTGHAGYARGLRDLTDVAPAVMRALATPV
jgi:2,3-bisphosphoglycerate-independent phosphoglycerate mutase